jgi:hypothetical protein
VKETASLERAYRRVLACYPKAFRQESEQEILAVLLASAEEGQRWPRLAESAALVRGALLMRLRPFGRPPLTIRGAIRLMLFGAISSAGYLIVALAVADGLAEIALWLWMARAASRGRNRARVLSTVLFGLATLELGGHHGAAQVLAVLTWLTGLAAVCLLWRPASSAFFKSARAARLRAPSQIPGP